MPARAALNAYYAWRVQGLDSEQRQKFDEALYGWDDANKAAIDELMNGGGAS